MAAAHAVAAGEAAGKAAVATNISVAMDEVEWDLNALCVEGQKVPCI